MVDPLHIVFIICDYELNIDLCEECEKSKRKYTLLDISGYSCQVIRQIVETLSTLRYFYCSPEDFRGHLCWNFMLTSYIHTGKAGRSLGEWFEFSSSDINKMIEHLEITRNTCTCFDQAMESSDYIGLQVPFDWNQISLCIRDCLMKCRWSDRIACTPQKSTDSNSYNNSSIISNNIDIANTNVVSSISSSFNCSANINHIVLLGGLPGQTDIAQEFKGKHGVDKLLERLLLIQNNQTTSTSNNIRIKAVEEACNILKKKKLSISIISIPEARSFLITSCYSKYAPIVHKALNRISSDGFFSQCAPFKREYPCEFTQLVDHFGMIMQGFFLSIVPFDDQENRNVFQLEFTIQNEQFRANCVPADSGDVIINRMLNYGGNDSPKLYLKNLKMISKLDYNILFMSTPLCFGYLDITFPLKMKYFEGKLDSSSTTVKYSPSKASHCNQNPSSQQVIINFFPYSNLFTVSVLERFSSFTKLRYEKNNDSCLNRNVASINESNHYTLDIHAWFKKAKAIQHKEMSAVDQNSMKRALRDNWKEDLVPTYEHLRYMPSQTVKVSKAKTAELFKCTADEAMREYIRYFTGLLDGTITPEVSLSDFVQRALLSGGLRLRNYINDTDLWYGPEKYIAAHKKMKAKAIKRYKTKEEIYRYAIIPINYALIFQFETALVLGQLQDAKTPSLSIRCQDEIDSDEEQLEETRRKHADDDSIFEIVNFLRWVVTKYPDAGTAAARSLNLRNKAGCKFAGKVYSEMYRDNEEASPSLSERNASCDRHSDGKIESRRKRKSYPLPSSIDGSGTQNLATEYKKYAKRYSSTVSSNNNLRLVNMTAAEWQAANDEFFVPETPNTDDNESNKGDGPDKENKDKIEFSIAATPSHVYESAHDKMDAELRAKQKKSAERTAKRILVYKEKMRRILSIPTEYKHPSSKHLIFAKELKYYRKLNILTNWNNVRRQIFPEYGTWYSSESSETSSDLE